MDLQAYRPTQLDDPRQGGQVPVFAVRRQADGDCDPECDFNVGRCLMAWRHPAGTVPWDQRCGDGDTYVFARVAEGTLHAPPRPA